MATERFISSHDGTTLYTSANGSGTPLLLCDGLGCDGFIWKYINRDFATTNRLIHWHYRGHGASQPPADPDALRVQDFVDDMLEVLDAWQVDRAVLMGHSMGVQLVLEFALQHPDRVRALVPVCGSYGHPLDTFHDSGTLGLLFPLLRAVVTRHPRQVQSLWSLAARSELTYQVAKRFEVNGRIVRRADFKPYFEHMSSMDVELFMRLLENVSQHTVEDRLDQIQAPTLIVAGEYDSFTPSWLSRRMARLIPNAELLVIPGGTHVALIEIPELVRLRLERFFAGLDGQPAGRASSAADVPVPTTKRSQPSAAGSAGAVKKASTRRRSGGSAKADGARAGGRGRRTTGKAGSKTRGTGRASTASDRKNSKASRAGTELASGQRDHDSHETQGATAADPDVASNVSRP